MDRQEDLTHIADTSIDPRTKRTKASLREALGTLLLEKSLEQISISELCKVAGLNRSTFYLHYSNVAELFGQIEDDLLADFRSTLLRYERQVSPRPYRREQPNYTASKGLLQETYTFMLRYRAFAPIILADRSGSRLLTILFNLGEEAFLAEWRSLETEPFQHEGYYFYNYIASGIIGLLKAWHSGGMNESPAEMAELTVKFMYCESKFQS